jgi:hypothetical protein
VQTSKIDSHCVKPWQPRAEALAAQRLRCEPAASQPHEHENYQRTNTTAEPLSLQYPTNELASAAAA